MMPFFEQLIATHGKICNIEYLFCVSNIRNVPLNCVFLLIIQNQRLDVHLK